MHIEPGVIDAAKTALSYGTASASLGFAGRLAIEAVERQGGLSLAVRGVLTTLLVLGFFQVLPHQPVGVSEVHLILGSTLFLIFGVAPAALGLAAGLLLQGLLFAPSDLPQYGANVTTLLVPLFAMAPLARRVIAEEVAYREIRYSQALKLSLAYQGGIVAWVAIWAFYGQGFSAETWESVFSFGAAYMSVVILEPLIDLAVLAGARRLSCLEASVFVDRRLFAGAA